MTGVAESASGESHKKIAFFERYYIFGTGVKRTACVRANGGMSSYFQTSQGVRQGWRHECTLTMSC